MICAVPHAYGEDMLVALRLNGQPVSEGEIVSVDGDNILLPLALTHQLRLIVPPTLIAANPDTIALSQLPGVKARLDRQAMVLDIDADAEAFETMVIQSYVPTRPADAPATPGMFLNYNLLTQDTGMSTLSSGLFSLGGFSDAGVAIADMSATSDQGPRRLRNYLTHDLGEGQGSLVVGDGFLPSGAIGEQYPFGGFQVTSRSAANTDVRQIPVETMLGQADIPSTVDVFVNDALQSHQTVPAGPFVLENIPVATGDGNIRVVVRDALGQERVVVRSFYSSPYLLPAGQGEYSYEGGMLRQNYGSANFDYNEPFASGTQRYGWSKEITTEMHGEASLRRQVIGEQTSFLAMPFGMIRAGAAVSDRDGSTGVLGLLGAESDTHPFSAGFSSETSSAHFTQLGYDGDRTLRQSAQARISYDLDNTGSLSASLIRLNITGQPLSDTAAVSYNVNMQGLGFLGASLFKTLGSGATGGTVTLSIPLGETSVASAQVTHDQSGWNQSGQFVQNVPNDGGWGYRAQIDHSSTVDHGEAGVTYRSSYNEITADAGMLNQTPIGRVGATGSLGLFDGEAFAAHQTDGNFAVVDTNGIGGVHVFADQQLAGVTDDDGKLVIAHLRPYEINRISLDPSDIPFDVSVPQSEMEVVPRNQTGYVVAFPLQHTRTAVASLIDDNDHFIAAGSAARNIKTDNSFTVGNDGIVYLTDLTGHDQFEVTSSGGSCKIDISLDNTKDVQPDLGKIKCHA